VTGSRNEWWDVVINGALIDNGMVSFKDQISEDEAEAIRAYVTYQAHLAVRNGEANP
jgi:hypothetical protein